MAGQIDGAFLDAVKARPALRRERTSPVWGAEATGAECARNECGAIINLWLIDGGAIAG